MRKVVVFVGAPEAERVRDVIALSGGERLGNYSKTVYSSAHLYAQNVPRVIDEEKIEFACDDDTFMAIVSAINCAVPATGAVVDSWSIESYQ